MNVSLGLQTEFEFDDFRFITLHDSSATEITYFKNEGTFCAFRTSDSDQIIETPKYDHMITDQYWAKSKLFVVTKDRKRGLIDFNGKVILPVEYDEIYYTNDKSCSEKPCVKLIKGDSVEFLDPRTL